MGACAGLGVLALQEQTRLLVAFLVEIMEEVGWGILGHGNGKGIKACEEGHEVGLGVGVDAGDGILELEQGVEKLLFGGGHALGIPQIWLVLKSSLRRLDALEFFECGDVEDNGCCVKEASRETLARGG